MNALLDFAGVILYYVFMPFLMPLQLLLYVLFGVWLSIIFVNRLLLQTIQFVKHLQPSHVWMPVRRLAGFGAKKLVRVPVQSAH